MKKKGQTDPTVIDGVRLIDLLKAGGDATSYEAVGTPEAKRLPADAKFRDLFEALFDGRVRVVPKGDK